MQVAALEIGCDRPLNKGLPESVLGLKPFIVDLLEIIKLFVAQTPQLGWPRITGKGKPARYRFTDSAMRAISSSGSTSTSSAIGQRCRPG